MVCTQSRIIAIMQLMMNRLMRMDAWLFNPDKGSFDLDEVVLILLEPNIEPRPGMLDT
jgi:hypothetical protein